MRVTDAFRAEHGVFYAQFDTFETAMDGDTVDCVRRRAAMLAAGLEPHAHLENELLFDVMEARVEGAEDLLAVMRDEHQRIEAALHRIQNASSLEAAYELLREMIAAARDHFEKEERVAFPLAEERLADAELRVLGARWAEARGVLQVAAGP